MNNRQSVPGLNIFEPSSGLRQYIKQRQNHLNETLSNFNSDGHENDDFFDDDLFDNSRHNGIESVKPREASFQEQFQQQQSTDKNPYIDTSFSKGNVSIAGDSVIGEGDPEVPLEEISAILPVPRESQKLMPPPPPSVVIESAPPNPYDTTFDAGNVYISGDSVADPQESVTASPRPSQSRALPAPPPPPRETSQAPASKRQPQPVVPRTMQEMYKANFHRPFITTEGFNLDDFRQLPEPKDAQFQHSKKVILNHRNQIREKFATMQSANTITSVLYFEQPLDPKCFIDTSKEEKAEVTQQKAAVGRKRKSNETFKEFWDSRRRDETQEATTSGNIYSKLANTTFASIFAKYSKPSNSRNKENHLNLTRNFTDNLGGLSRAPTQPAPQPPGGPNQSRGGPDITNTTTDREADCVSYMKSMMHHYLNYGTAPPVEEIDKVPEKTAAKRQQKMVTFDETANEEFSFAKQVQQSLEDQKAKEKNQSFQFPDPEDDYHQRPMSFNSSRSRSSASANHLNTSFRSDHSSKLSSISSKDGTRQDLKQSFLSMRSAERRGQASEFSLNVSRRNYEPSITMDMSLYPFFKF